MSYHKFYLSNSSFEKIDVDKRDVDEVLSRYGIIPSNSGYSLSEWSKKLGFGEKKTSKWLKDQLFEGKMRVSKIPIIDITGRLNYSFVNIKEENGTEE